LIRRPEVTYDKLMAHAKGRFAPADTEHTLAADIAPQVREQAEIHLKYAGYIATQAEEVERATHTENLRLPEGLDYAQVTALSFEARQKLAKHQPETLGQASRISGITPATISLLLIHLKKGRMKGFAANDSKTATATTAGLNSAEVA
jgi:tRNA uridine 5-carboxymethylaminomethyl modification enzyme